MVEVINEFLLSMPPALVLSLTMYAISLEAAAAAAFVFRRHGGQCVDILLPSRAQGRRRQKFFSVREKGRKEGTAGGGR
jgi:hypothetical protein